jgi:multiple sugar transport system ATP-binding protein
VALDASSGITAGDAAELWIDTSKIHIFDPASGENLTRDETRVAELARVAERAREAQRRAQRPGEGAGAAGDLAGGEAAAPDAEADAPGGETGEEGAPTAGAAET